MAYGRVNTGIPLKRIKGAFFPKWTDSILANSVTAFNCNDKLYTVGYKNGRIGVYNLENNRSVYHMANIDDTHSISNICIDENGNVFGENSYQYSFKLDKNGNKIWYELRERNSKAIQNTSTGVIFVFDNGTVMCVDKNASTFKYKWYKTIPNVSYVLPFSVVNKNGNVVVPVKETNSRTYLYEINSIDGSVKNKIDTNIVDNELTAFSIDANGDYVFLKGGTLYMYITSHDNSFPLKTISLFGDLNTGDITYFLLDDTNCVFLTLYSSPKKLYAIDFNGKMLNDYDLIYNNGGMMKINESEFILFENSSMSSGGTVFKRLNTYVCSK